MLRDVESLWRELKCTAYALTKNSDDAEDVVQSAFLRALEHRDLLAADSNWRGWLRTVMRHLVIDRARRDKSWPRIYGYNVAQFPQPVPEADSAWDEITQEDVARAVQACDRIFREVYELHYEQGLSYTEIATRMNLPLGTVSTRLRRARAHIRSRLISREQSASASFSIGQLSLPRPQPERDTIMKIKKIEQTKVVNTQAKDAKDAVGVQPTPHIKAGAASLVAVCG